MVKPINLTQVSQSVTQGQSSQKSSQVETGQSFADVLNETQNLTFSKHAQNRLESRQISLNDEGMARLQDAVAKAEKRGSSESLILMDDMAFIVNVKEHMVVTAMDATKRGEGVFTNIDSVVLANSTNDKSQQA